MEINVLHTGILLFPLQYSAFRGPPGLVVSFGQNGVVNDVYVFGCIIFIGPSQSDMTMNSIGTRSSVNAVIYQVDSPITKYLAMNQQIWRSKQSYAIMKTNCDLQLEYLSYPEGQLDCDVATACLIYT